MGLYVFLEEDLGTVKILMYNKKKERLISLSFLLKTITAVIVNNYLNHDQRLLHLHIPLLG